MRVLAVIIAVLGVIASLALDRLVVPGASGEKAGRPESEVQLVRAPDVPTEVWSGGGVTIARSPDGHFYADARINGEPQRVLVDTGATMVALSRTDAARAGIDVRPEDFTLEASTASGPVRYAPVVIRRLEIGPIVATDVEAAVLDIDRVQPLLGQTFLAELREISIEDDQLTLR